MWDTSKRRLPACPLQALSRGRCCLVTHILCVSQGALWRAVCKDNLHSARVVGLLSWECVAGMLQYFELLWLYGQCACFVLS